MAGSRKVKIKKSPEPVLTPAVVEDDDELVGDLLAELDSRDQTESANVINEVKQGITDSDRKQDAKTRFNARRARKAAELAQHYAPNDFEADARLAKEARDEEKDIQITCDELNVQIHHINPDGHCLFSAVADQLVFLSIVPEASYVTARQAASTYIYTHPDDFLPFLPSPSGEDGIGSIDAGLISPQHFKDYCVAIRDTAIWGGELEILALSKAYNVPIHVIQGGSPPVVVHNPTGEPTVRDLHARMVVRVSYHRRMYGLGEHYNSLRPKN